MTESKYDIIARFYDDVIGRSFDSNKFIIETLEAYGSNVKSVLEFGCGTGSILNDLKKKYKVAGIDISKEMLSIAAKKVPAADLHKGDIRTVDLKKQFDAVLCMYDTVNHLTTFNDWVKLFKNAYRHLAPKGIFLFDMNTLNKLEYLAFIKTYFYTFEKNYLVINVKKLRKDVYNWELNVFEHQKGDTFKLYKQNVPEAVFKIRQVKEALKSSFVVKKTFAEGLDKVSDSSDRVYFVCQKR